MKTVHSGKEDFKRKEILRDKYRAYLFVKKRRGRKRIKRKNRRKKNQISIKLDD